MRTRQRKKMKKRLYKVDIIESDSQKKHNRKIWLIGLIVSILALFPIYDFYKDNIVSPKIAKVESVSLSSSYFYSRNNYIDSIKQSHYSLEDQPEVYDLGVGVSVFIDNNIATKELMVSKSYIEIDEIKLTDFPDISIHSFINKDILYVYVINNSFADTKNCSVKLDFEGIISDNYHFDLLGGEIMQLQELNLNNYIDSFTSYNNELQPIKELIGILDYEGHQEKYGNRGIPIAFNPNGIEGERFYVAAGGFGDINTTGGGVIINTATDQGKTKEILLNEPVIIDNIHNIIATIIPDRSSQISFYITYELSNGNILKTDLLTYEFKVPVYGDGWFLGKKDQLITYNIKNYKYNTNMAFQLEMQYDPINIIGELFQAPPQLNY